MIQFEVLGIPKAQPRTKIARQGAFVRAYDPAAEEKLSLSAEIKRYAPVKPIDEPIVIKIEFYMPRPNNHYGSGRNAGVLKANAPLWCSSKPDLDNMIKYITDTMNAVFYRDDALIFWITANKRYADMPKTRVMIQTISELSGEIVVPDKNKLF
jgi:Holliday junction resolvase RusA-like endonuclease